MKKVIAAVVFVALLCGGAWADVAINSTNFPDENFRSYVSRYIDKDSNGTLSDSEIASATNIHAHGSNISSLQGVEYFTALTELYCGINQLTALDVSKNTALTGLYCDTNQLTALDVSNNTALTTLNCNINQLTALDVSKNTALEGLYCEINQLTALDVSNNTALTTLNCRSNQLTSPRC